MTIMQENLILDDTNEGGETYGTAFASFYQAMTNVPFFGTYYNYIVPLFILVIGLLTYLRFLKKMERYTTKVQKLNRQNTSR